MKKVILKKIISKLELLPLLERLNFIRQKIKNRKSNLLFRKENPFVKLPPDFYLYETFNLNYKKFYTDGIPTAKWLFNHLKEFKEFNNISILDWGCGTGRILRHLPLIAGGNNSYFGCDYNEKYVKWCSENIDIVNFKLNNLSPPLDYETSSFDVIYGISIFTHLSEELHDQWMRELTRVLKKEGLLFITTHGCVHKYKLLEKEKQTFELGNIVVHSYKKEGNRLFASYQPPVFMEKLCKTNSLAVLKHIPGEIRNNKPQQDVWIFRKK
jgi:SAM-dependent methyltransferase